MQFVCTYTYEHRHIMRVQYINNNDQTIKPCHDSRVYIDSVCDWLGSAYTYADIILNNIP